MKNQFIFETKLLILLAFTLLISACQGVPTLRPMVSLVDDNLVLSDNKKVEPKIINILNGDVGIYPVSGSKMYLKVGKIYKSGMGLTCRTINLLQNRFWEANTESRVVCREVAERTWYIVPSIDTGRQSLNLEL